MDSITVQRRIRIPADKNDILDVLCSTDDGIFESKAHAMLFAASIGFKGRKREAFEKSGEPIRFSVFENIPYSQSVISLLSIIETSATKVLAQERFEERAKIFEEYANSGLEILRTRIKGSPGSTLELLIAILSETCPAPKGVDESLISEFVLKL